MVELHWTVALAAVAVPFAVGVAWGSVTSQRDVRRRARQRRLRAFGRGYVDGVADERRRWETSMRTPQ